MGQAGGRGAAGRLCPTLAAGGTAAAHLGTQKQLGPGRAQPHREGHRDPPREAMGHPDHGGGKPGGAVGLSPVQGGQGHGVPAEGRGAGRT